MQSLSISPRTSIPSGQDAALQPITIADNANLIVRVIEYDDEVITATGQPPLVRQIAEFRVHREALIRSSRVLASFLGSGFAEARQDSVDLNGDSILAMEVWFRIIHGCAMETTYDIPIENMWHIVIAADKYDLDIKQLKDWFENWYHCQNKDSLEPRELLYPCYAFDYARGFLLATKTVVYETVGHITEVNPTRHYELHLPHRVIRKSYFVLPCTSP